MLRKRFSLRQKVDLACTCTFEQNERAATMLNLSRGGCYLGTSVEGLREETHCTISLPLQGDGKSYRLPGRIVWINRAGQDEKPVGFGCEFDKKQTGDDALHHPPLRAGDADPLEANGRG